MAIPIRNAQDTEKYKLVNGVNSLNTKVEDIQKDLYSEPQEYTLSHYISYSNQLIPNALKKGYALISVVIEIIQGGGANKELDITVIADNNTVKLLDHTTSDTEFDTNGETFNLPTYAYIAKSNHPIKFVDAGSVAWSNTSQLTFFVTMLFRKIL